MNLLGKTNLELLEILLTTNEKELSYVISSFKRLKIFYRFSNWEWLIQTNKEIFEKQQIISTLRKIANK